jgi:hypothetical protein
MISTSTYCGQYSLSTYSEFIFEFEKHGRQPQPAGEGLALYEESRDRLRDQFLSVRKRTVPSIQEETSSQERRAILHRTASSATAQYSLSPPPHTGRGEAGKMPYMYSPTLLATSAINTTSAFALPLLTALVPSPITAPLSYTHIQQFATEGCSYGSVELENTDVLMQSVVSKNDMFRFPLSSVQLAVVPANNRDDVEIQFQEADKPNKHEDCLVQMTFHFPNEEDEEGASLAEVFHSSIMDTGIIRSVTGNILAEFTKEQGSFVSPRY